MVDLCTTSSGYGRRLTARAGQQILTRGMGRVSSVFHEDRLPYLSLRGICLEMIGMERLFETRHEP